MEVVNITGMVVIIIEFYNNKKSIVIASQLPVSKWQEDIAEPTLADNIMDTLMANAQRLN